MSQGDPLSPDPSGQFIVRGQTLSGKTFRPSDWAERLAGVLSPYRPGYRASAAQAMVQGFSPYAQPVVHEGLKCVVVDGRLRQIEPMAWDFVCGFARDNQLVMEPFCEPD